ncbi:hypothetical protein QNH20_02380 [Neobacillus sp. WH10]|uniref:hypothetical protein n=1 Tax=Neobacillus sp. WH10 TaxID=3047873 RepID=UPI0024C15F87|nr:hypothetical protein [Neobacillus sp. WH10]WHY78036.1 hypothetical protein QNH20_02380 [Neobacillus sp. WH10]
MKAEGISLTTNELASALALCGYESMASQVLNNLEIQDRTEEFDRFIEDTELSLLSKGFLDVSRNSTLAAGLEDLLHVLVQSKRKVRCIKKDRVLFIHYTKGDSRTLLQEIRNNTHFFSIYSMDKGFEPILLNHYEIEGKPEQPVSNLPTLQLSEAIYNQLHQMEPNVLDTMINDERIEGQLKLFLSDFRDNKQEFDNLSLIEMDYVKDYMEMKQVIFLLPSVNFVWHLDYDRIQEREVFVIPSSVKEYSKRLSDAIALFFGEI